MEEKEHVSTVLGATGRQELNDALAWIIEGRRLTGAVRTDELMGALATLGTPSSRTALRTIARSALASRIDPSAHLLGLETVTRPGVYRAALEEVARYTPSGSLVDMTPEAVAFAQERNPHVMVTLGLVAGLSWRDLRDRVVSLESSPGIPTSPGGPWSQQQVSAALDVISGVVNGTEIAQIEGATSARPVELLFDETPAAGWTAVSNLLREGVSYETLLAQRAVGGAWLSHRQATTGHIPALIADELCVALERAGLALRRGTAVGGEMSREHLKDLLRGEPGQVGIVVVSNSGDPRLAIAISVARDGGTARKNGGRLRMLPSQFDAPAAVLLIGHGWAERGESLELIRAFAGRVFTERTIDALVSVATALTSVERK